MLSSFSWSELLTLAVPLLVGGIVTGLLAGLLGVGGGALIVPVLYEVFGALGVDEAVRMQLCVGTSLAIIVPTSLQSYRAHKARGAVLPGILRVWSVPAFVGVSFGSVIAAFAQGWVLQAAFIVIALVMAIKALAGRSDWRIADTLPGTGTQRVYAFFIGVMAALVGISGGGLVTMVLSLYGVPIHVAVATSAGIGMIVPLPGIIGYAVGGWSHMADLPPLSIGYVSLIGFACMAPVSTAVAPIGARLAHRLPRRALEIGFGGFLLLMVARFLIAILWR